MTFYDVGIRGVFFFLAPAIFFGMFGVSYAQDSSMTSGAFVVKPAKVELDIPPGKSEVRTLSLTNSTALPIAVTVSFEDVAPQKQGTPTDDPVVLLGGEGGAYPLRDLVGVKSNSLTIPSGATIAVPVTVSIPRDAVPSGHYGSVVFSFKPILSGEQASRGSVAIESRLATMFYVRVSGVTKEEGRLLGFGLFNNEHAILSPTSLLPMRMYVTFENTGTVHLNPYGRITLTSFFGNTHNVLVDPWAVLPSGERTREINFHEPLAVGYYTAQLEQNRGYQDVVDTKEIHFFVIPTPEQGFVIFIGVLFLILLLRKSLSLSKHFVS